MDHSPQAFSTRRLIWSSIVEMLYKIVLKIGSWAMSVAEKYEVSFDRQKNYCDPAFTTAAPCDPADVTVVLGVDLPRMWLLDFWR